MTFGEDTVLCVSTSDQDLVVLFRERFTEPAAKADTVFDPGSQKGVADLVQATHVQARTTEIAIYYNYNAALIDK